MKYKITHITTYSYSDLVPVCQNQVHLAPRSTASQTCKQHRLAVKPVPAHIGKRADYFGNPVNYFSIAEGHRKLIVTSVSKVDVQPPPLPNFDDSPAWETLRDALPVDHSARGLDAYQFVFDSPYVARAEMFAEYARPSFAPGRPILAAASELTARIHADFKYDPTATTVHTPLPAVFAQRRGVCQDLAHVEIACLRSLGLAARYVSGYLRTVPPPGKERLVGADASHAWIAVYAGTAGWVDLDPTNDVAPRADHVTIAWGRDYGDICPISGMFVGGGQHTMTVNVDVEPEEE